jgi:hypothetical protein
VRPPRSYNKSTKPLLRDAIFCEIVDPGTDTVSVGLELITPLGEVPPMLIVKHLRNIFHYYNFGVETKNYLRKGS